MSLSGKQADLAITSPKITRSERAQELHAMIYVCYRQRLIPENCFDECRTPALSAGVFACVIVSCYDV
jgi:hypothetical protein